MTLFNLVGLVLTAYGTTTVYPLFGDIMLQYELMMFRFQAL